MNTRVSFKIANLLEEKGYPFEYTTVGEVKNVPLNIPTLMEVVMWLYEKYDIWIYVDFYNENRWFGVFRNKQGVKTELFDVFNSPTESYEAAIEYTLNKLINI